MLEHDAPDDALIAAYRTGAANDSGEEAYVFFARDENGNKRKVGSISAVTPVYTSTGLYGCVRYNASYTVNGTGFDDLSIRQFGGIGITLFGTSNNDVPNTGYKLLNRGATWNTQKHRFGGGVSIAATSAPSTESGCVQLFLDENDGAFKVRLSNGDIKTVMLA